MSIENSFDETDMSRLRHGEQGGHARLVHGKAFELCLS